MAANGSISKIKIQPVDRCTSVSWVAHTTLSTHTELGAARAHEQPVHQLLCGRFKRQGRVLKGHHGALHGIHKIIGNGLGGTANNQDVFRRQHNRLHTIRFQQRLRQQLGINVFLQVTFFSAIWFGMGTLLKRLDAHRQGLLYCRRWQHAGLYSQLHKIGARYPPRQRVTGTGNRGFKATTTFAERTAGLERGIF